MMHIRDAVSGDIIPTPAQLGLIDDPNVQRLSSIRQLGFAYLVYPGANHTRFEHSLGTMVVTREIVESATGERDEELECAGLLHDIGHPAFSHFADKLLKIYLHTDHEKLGEERIMENQLRDRINDAGLSLKKIIGYFRGVGKGGIITGALGSDRLDYLIRDARYTGVAYGLIDYPNIRSKMAIYKGNPAIYESGLRAGEQILLARYFMFQSVYMHHATLIAQGMYERAVINAIESGKMEKEELKTLNDWQMLSRLTQIKESAGMANRLAGRRLFKRAYYAEVSGVDMDALKDAIAKAGFEEGEYMASLLNYRGADDNVDVLDRHGHLAGKLSEMSPLVKTLGDILRNKRRLLVACERKRIGELHGVVERVMKK
jgi:hypothetical protein